MNIVSRPYVLLDHFCDLQQFLQILYVPSSGTQKRILSWLIVLHLINIIFNSITRGLGLKNNRKHVKLCDTLF